MDVLIEKLEFREVGNFSNSSLKSCSNRALLECSNQLQTLGDLSAAANFEDLTWKAQIIQKSFRVVKDCKLIPTSVELNMVSIFFLKGVWSYETPCDCASPE